MTRCSVCRSHAVAKCSECGALICMNHSNTFYDEKIKKMRQLCGNCLARRMPVWGRFKK